MERARIFIGSSIKSHALAQKLRDNLYTDYSVPTIWSEEAEGQPYQTVFEMLEEASKFYDFAVIIITKGDLVLKKGRDKRLWQDRYNCIYQAGLFMGALGRNRCFLVSSLGHEDLPSDLSGIIYMPIPEPDDLTNHEAITNALKMISSKIKNAIVLQGSRQTLILPVLTQEELFQREKHREEGGLLREDLIVIFAIQPLQVSFDIISQISHNLSRNVRYIYFLPADSNCGQIIIRFLQLILLAEVLKDPTEAAKFKDRLDLVEVNQKEVLSRLEKLREENLMKFWFLPEKPALEYTIHNANDITEAQAYFKINDGFVNWCTGEKARDIWAYLRKLLTRQESSGLFQLTPFFDFDPVIFKNSLDMELKRHFPLIHEQVRTLCYGKEFGRP